MGARLAERLGAGADAFDVSSAGTWGCVGAPMEPFSELALQERGVSFAGFVARELTSAMVQEADLVLTATREHRSHVVGLVPGSVRRSFTLKEFARLAPLVAEADQPPTEDPVSGALTRVEIAGRVRGLADRVDPSADDIEDPLGAPAQIYLGRAAEIDQACVQAVDLLLGTKYRGLDH